MSDGGDSDPGGGGGGGYGGGYGGGGYGRGSYSGSYGGSYGGDYTDPGTDPAEADRESARGAALGGLGGGGGSGANLGGDARDTANYDSGTGGYDAEGNAPNASDRTSVTTDDRVDAEGNPVGTPGERTSNITDDRVDAEGNPMHPGATSTTFGGDARDTGNYDAPAPAQGDQGPGNQPAPDSQSQGAPAPATAPADEGPGNQALAVPGSFDAEQGLLPGAFDPATYAPGQPSRDQNFGDTPGIQGAVPGATTNEASVGPAANVSQAGGLSTNAVDSLNQSPGLGTAPATGSVVGAGNLASALSGDTPVSQALGTAPGPDFSALAEKKPTTGPGATTQDKPASAPSKGYGVGETGPVQLTEAEKARAAGGVGETGPVPVAGAAGSNQVASLDGSTPSGLPETAPSPSGFNLTDPVRAAQEGMAKWQASQDTSPLPGDAPTPDQPAPVPGGINEGPPPGMADVPSNMNMKLAGNDFGPGTTILGVEVDGKPTTAPETPSYAQKDPMSFLTNEGFNDTPTFPLADNNVAFNALSRTEMLGASNQGIAPGMTFENGQPKDLGNAAAAVPTLTSNQDKFLTGGSRVADSTPNQGFGMGFDATNPNIPGLTGGNLTPGAETGYTYTGQQVAGPNISANPSSPDATRFTPDSTPTPTPSPGTAPYTPSNPNKEMSFNQTEGYTGQSNVNNFVENEPGAIPPDTMVKPAVAGPATDTATPPAAGPAPTTQGGTADQPAPSSTSFGPDVAKALNDADGGGGGGGNAPPAGRDIPLASQLLQPIPGGPVETPQTPQTPYPGFLNPGLGDQGSPAGNYNPEAGVYAPQGRPGGPVPLDPAVIAALNNA